MELNYSLNKIEILELKSSSKVYSLLFRLLFSITFNSIMLLNVNTTFDTLSSKSKNLIDMF